MVDSKKNKQVIRTLPNELRLLVSQLRQALARAADMEEDGECTPKQRDDFYKCCYGEILHWKSIYVRETSDEASGGSGKGTASLRVHRPSQDD